MSKVYKNQTKLLLRLETYVNITGCQAAKIRYRKPSGTTGEFSFPSQVTIENAETGILSHMFQIGELNESGQWTFWAFIIFSDGRWAAGEPDFIHVYDEGE